MMFHLGVRGGFAGPLWRESSATRSKLCAVTSGLLSKIWTAYVVVNNVGAATDSKQENVIRVPCKMHRHIENVKQLKERKLKKVALARPGKLLIASKRSELSQHSSYTYGKFEQPALVSKGWKHKKSSGDYFTIINTQNEPPVVLAEEAENSHKKMPAFKSLGLCSELVEALDTMGITCPTRVQLQTIPTLLKGKNVLCAAETGSGKTLSYLLPQMHKLQLESLYGIDVSSMSPRSVVLVPSRELADQVRCVAKTLGRHLNLSVKTIGGGRGIGNIRKALSSDVIDILIATPGALWKALRRDFVTLSNLTYLVLDEADTLFDESFKELVQYVLQHTEIASSPLDMHERKAQLVVIGATFPGGVGELLSEVTDLGSITTIKSKRLHFLMPHVKQKFMKLKGAEKLTELLQIIKTLAAEKSGTGLLVFCNNAATVNWLGYILDDHGIKHVRLQGQMPAEMRTGIFSAFQKGSVDVLVCTDIASRGLDTQRVEMVINYDFPPSLADYIHRAGRVGRVGSKVPGTVVSFVTHPWDVELVQKIESAARRKMSLPGMESAVNPPLPKIDLTESGSRV